MNCKIIRALLPLYHDGVISEESRELVEKHLETCEECRGIFEDIRENIRTKNVPDMEQPMVSGFKVLKKRLRRKTVFNVAISVICAVALVSALTYGVFFYQMPAPYSEVTRTITQPVDSALDFITNVKGHVSISVLLKGDALYICYWDTFWTRHFVKSNKYISLEIPDVPDVPDVPSMAPVAPGMPDLPDIPDLPEMPEPPEPPNPLILIGEKVTKVYYFEGNLSKFADDDAVFSEAAGNAVLLWEK
jgi:hypothetical protein